MDIPLGSLKSEGHVAAFSCDVTGRYAILADTQGLAIMVSVAYLIYHNEGYLDHFSRYT
jgi:hypothetical protein